MLHHSRLKKVESCPSILETTPYDCFNEPFDWAFAHEGGNEEEEPWPGLAPQADDPNTAGQALGQTHAQNTTPPDNGAPSDAASTAEPKPKRRPGRPPKDTGLTADQRRQRRSAVRTSQTE
eukprot:SAG31_NODE_8245_length_1490_cov_1.662832_1_plen_121_part_00